jgi:hypothetical protein
MSTISKAALGSLRPLRWLTPVFLAMSLGVPAAAEDSCDSKSFEIPVPDASTLKLAEGVHTIAKAKAPHGEFEVRVRVKGSEISENEFWANGKRLGAKLDAKTPPEFVKCLKEQKVQISDVGFAEEMLRALSGLVEHSAEAKNTKCVLKVTASCYQYAPGKFWCAYHVCCGSSCSVDFDPLP